VWSWAEIKSKTRGAITVNEQEQNRRKEQWKGLADAENGLRTARTLFELKNNFVNHLTDEERIEFTKWCVRVAL
jgi:hypothetical protein